LGDKPPSCLLPVTMEKTNGYPLASTKQVRVASPVSFLMQKILVQDARDRQDRAKEILYIHDTIETFAGHLAELRDCLPTNSGQSCMKRRLVI